MKTELVNITPAIAELMLTAHFKRIANSEFRQRNISQAKVEQYARDMADGNWLLTHQGIAILKDGDLIDGQHRLMAIKLSGKTIRMLVSTELEDEEGLKIMDTIDCGKPRTVRDQLQISHAMPNAFAVAATVRGILFTLLRHTKHRSLSVAQTLEIAEIYKNDITPTNTIGRSPAYVNSTIALYHHAFPEKAQDFTDKYLSLVGLEEGHPIQVWMRALRTIKGNPKKTWSFQVFINCVYKFHLNETLNSLRPSDEAIDWIIDIQGKDGKYLLSHFMQKQIITQDKKTKVYAKK